MNVFSNVGSIAPGTGISTGNIEFWPTNYLPDNDFSVPNASSTVYDFGDSPIDSGTWGSMQIHNYDIDGTGPGTTGQTVFGFNNWNTSTSGAAGLGIGTHVGGNDSDWTFANNVNTYTVKNMAILVHEFDPTATLQSIVVTPANTALYQGLSQQFMVTGTYSNNLKLNITSRVNWTSDADSVATISATGLATGVSGGVSSITAAINGMTDKSVLGVSAVSLTNVTGFNRDVVFEKESPHTALGFDNGGGPNSLDSAGAAWFEGGAKDVFEIIQNIGLPSDDVPFVSPNGTPFQFQEFSDNNVLMLGNGSPDTGMLTLAAPQAYSRLAVLATSGKGSGDGSVVINFADGRQSSALTFTANDWSSLTGALPAPVKRAALRHSGSSFTTGADDLQLDVQMHETVFDLAALGLNTKVIQSLTFTKSTNPQETGIFSVSLFPPGTLQSLIVTPTRPGVISLNKPQQFTATGTYYDGRVKDLTSQVNWTSSNTSVVTVNNGLATTVSEGTSTITASFNGITATSAVTATVLYDRTSNARGITAAENAFDNDADTSWIVPGESGGRIQYQFPNNDSYVVTRYTISEANNSTAHTERIPVGWNLEGSNDGSNWVILDTQEYPSINTYDIPNTTAYKFYALSDVYTNYDWHFPFGSMYGGEPALIELADLRLFGPYSTLESFTLTPDRPTVAKGLTQQFITKGTYSDGSIHEFPSTWSTDTNSVATISPSGLATGLFEGILRRKLADRYDRRSARIM